MLFSYLSLLLKTGQCKNSMTQHEGVYFPVLMTGKVMEKIKNFEVRSQDLWICGFPKTGTTWLQIALSQLYDDWGTCKLSSKGKVPLFDIPGVPGIDGFEKCCKAASPRLMKSHLPARFFPELKGKVIYVCRNPKDTAVSLFHMLQCYKIQVGNWEEFFEKFMGGKVVYGSWLSHVESWLALKDDKKVLFVHYEDMKKDFAKELRRICEFIERPMASEIIDKVAAASEFEQMKKKVDKVAIPLIFYDKKSPFFRKGIVGDWKNYFSLDQSRRVDQEFSRQLAIKGLNFDYEL